MDNTIINTKDALNTIINKLEKNQENMFLLDSMDGVKITLDNGAIYLLKSYYNSKISKLNKDIING